MAWTTRAAVALLAVTVVASCGGGGDADGSAAGSVPTVAPESTGQAEGEQSAATATARGVKLQRVATFDAPVFVTSPPGDRTRQFVVEQGGRVMVVRDGRKLGTPFLDLTGQVTSGSEQGLLSLAFAPDYAESGLFYIYFTDEASDQRIVEYRRRDADRADPASARLVLRMEDSESNHNGGLLLFGPDDLLYVGTGDGGGGGDQHGARGNGQNLGSLLGKILRIDPRASGGRAYSIPARNPFAGRAGARGEIYAYGLRNPWRFSFDRKRGDLSMGDVGQNAYEEINFVRRGAGRAANFGWRPYEGRSRYAEGESAPGHVRPVIVRAHSDGFCSVTGGVVVRDPRLPGLRGRYVWGDFCDGRIESARLSRGRARSVRNTALQVDSLSSFGEDAQGRVYVTSLEGPVYRIVSR